MNVNSIFPGLSSSLSNSSEKKPAFVNPFATSSFNKPKPEAPKEEPKEEVKPEIKEEPEEEVKEESKVQEIPKEEPTTEPQKEEKKVVEDKPAEPEPVPEAPKKSRRKSTKTAKSEEKASEAIPSSTPEASTESEPEIINVKFNPQKVNFKDIKTFFIPGVEDPEWKEMYDDIESQLQRIKLNSDMNAGTIRVLIPVLYDLFCFVRSAKTDYDALYTSICDKVVGIIPRQTAANSDGKNAAEQKKHGSMACETFKLETKKGTINLYDWAMVISYRREYLKSVLEKIEMAKGFLLSYQTLITKAEQ